MTSKPKNHGKPWTNAQITKVRSLARQQKTTSMIATGLARTPESVRSIASKEGIKLKPKSTGQSHTKATQSRGRNKTKARARIRV